MGPMSGLGPQGGNGGCIVTTVILPVEGTIGLLEEASEKRSRAGAGTVGPARLQDLEPTAVLHSALPMWAAPATSPPDAIKSDVRPTGDLVGA